jgi:hypothetical protein
MEMNMNIGTDMDINTETDMERDADTDLGTDMDTDIDIVYIHVLVCFRVCVYSMFILTDNFQCLLSMLPAGNFQRLKYCICRQCLYL